LIWEEFKSNGSTIRDKKTNFDLSVRNAKFYRIEQLKQLQIVDPDRHTNRIMAQMKKDLRSFEPSILNVLITQIFKGQTRLLLVSF
jgi:excinuclease ABC subunit C